MTRPGDLAPYMNRPDETVGARRGQGIILTWNAANGENTVDFRGDTYTNMPFYMFGNVIPAYTGGDVVIIEGWGPEGRFSSWYVLGRVVVPPAV